MTHNVESDGTISGRSLTPEERVKYKEFKGKIFSRVSCHFCTEKDQQIDTLTAELKLGAKMLARQTDLARDAETQLAVRLRSECACAGGECTHLPCDPWVARAFHAEQQISRLKDAAKGIGMVSEMADVEEVAVLVVGLHTEIDRLTAKLDAAHKDVRAFKFALGRIAIYGKDGICPYGCDCPDIASKALTSPTVRKIVEGV